jgi:hypothetical protein
MRLPKLDVDGWCLEDGEEYHRNAPTTFWIPELSERQQLQPGDLVKLIFQIAIDDPEDDVAIERMWVIVRERVPGGYLGILDNEPSSIDENDQLWLGTEFPFQPKHIINIDDPNDETLRVASATPKRRWS